MYRAHNTTWKLFAVILLPFFLLIPHCAQALEEDSKAKVFIIADSSIYNYKTGTTTYEGNVKVDQGTTHVTADRLVTKNNHQHKINEAIAYGTAQLAHYWTIPSVGDDEIHAKAKIIKFYPLASDVVLQQDVVVTQKENSFQGQLILYNRKDQTIIVPASQTGRAVLVYNPEKNDLT